MDVDGDKTHQSELVKSLAEDVEEHAQKQQDVINKKNHAALQAECNELVQMIMALQEESEEYRHQIAAFNEIIKRRKNEIVKSSSWIEVYNTKKANLKFEFERFSARKQGGLWMVIILSLWIARYLLINGGLYFVAFFVEYVFLLNLRSLYVKNVPYAKGLGVLTIMFIILLLLW